MTDAGQRDVSRTAAWLLLAVILAWALLWRVMFFYGWAASDDAAYHQCAVQFNAGETFHDTKGAVLDSRVARVSFNLAVAGWIRVFGESERALCSLDVVCGVAVVGLLYWLGAMVISRRVGLWAALLYSVYPIDLIYSGILFPDHFGLVFMLLTIGSYFKALTSRTRVGWAWIALGGVSLAIAVSAKETALVLGLLLPLVGLCRCRGRQFCIGAAISFVGFLVFLLEFPVQHAATGDWLYRLHASQAVFGPGGMGYREWASTRPFYYPVKLTLRHDLSGMFGWLLMAGGLWGLMRWRRYSFVIVWSLAVWVFLEFGSSR